jgi:hypothetical protein
LSNDERVTLAEHTLLRYHYDRRASADPVGTRPEYSSVRASFISRLQRSSLLLPDYLASVILAVAEQSGLLSDGKLYWVERTCFNELYAAQIFTWWDRAKLIQIIRDPRDTYAARLKRGSEHNSISAFAYTWRRSALQASRNMAAHGKERCLILRYEDLVRDPGGEIERICSFLGIPQEPIVLRPTKAAGRSPWIGNSAYGGEFAGVEARSLGRWRTLLGTNQVALLETLLRHEMLEHGYEPEIHASLIRHLEALPHRLVNFVRHIRNSKLRAVWNRPGLRWPSPGGPGRRI